MHYWGAETALVAPYNVPWLQPSQLKRAAGREEMYLPLSRYVLAG